MPYICLVSQQELMMDGAYIFAECQLTLGLLL